MIQITKQLRLKWYFVFFVAFCAYAISGCSEDTSGLGSKPSTSFTATPLSSNPNKIVVKSTTDDAFMWQWDYGNGTSASGETDTVTYINKGTYTIWLTAFGHGGADSTSKDVDIVSDYQGDNILMDDGALNSSDWTYLSIPGGGKVDVTYNDNTVKFSNNQYSYGAIYQPVQVKSGTKYKFSAHIKSSSGMGSESWFEIYFGTTEPQQGTDYTDNEYISLNTYVPCGGSSFDGDITSLGCSGSGTGKGGVITFSNTGTVYLVIKPGSNAGTLGSGGVTLTNISLSKL